MGRYHAIPVLTWTVPCWTPLTDMQDAVNHVLAAHGLPLRTLEEVRRFQGNGAGPLIHRALPEGYPQEQKVLAEYRAYYQAQTRPNLPLSGIRSCWSSCVSGAEAGGGIQQAG